MLTFRSCRGPAYRHLALNTTFPPAPPRETKRDGRAKNIGNLRKVFILCSCNSTVTAVGRWRVEEIDVSSRCSSRVCFWLAMNPRAKRNWAAATLAAQCCWRCRRRIGLLEHLRHILFIFYIYLIQTIVFIYFQQYLFLIFFFFLTRL